MLAKVYAPLHIGLDGQLVEIECDIANGLPAFLVVGLGDKAVDEARERVRGAFKNSGLHFPAKRLTLNLAPADLPKDGSAYDLAMALSLLIASGQVGQEVSKRALFLGELALDGGLRPVKGAIAACQLARDQGLTDVYLPSRNAAEAALIEGPSIYAVENLRQLYRHLIGEQKLKAHKFAAQIPTPEITTNLSGIYGQPQAKRALEIAAAGCHNLLLSGPPGCGKSLLAKALPGLLPPPSLDEIIEVTKLYSLVGQNHGLVVAARPFRHPHHTTSGVALIGGGQTPRPGEISLSHNGVLFLDELPEFPRSSLESLRQPLEDGKVTVARASSSVTFPAKFMLVATQNPCPCGFAGDSSTECHCSLSQITRYRRRISGPLLDRIDLIIELSRVKPSNLTESNAEECSQQVASRVQKARSTQALRFNDSTTTTYNAEMTNAEIKQFCELDNETNQLAKQALIQLGLSARSYTRVLKVARTIADLGQSQKIAPTHLSEALQYRARV